MKYTMTILALCWALYPDGYAQTASPPPFPEGWMGQWAGTLEIFNPTGKVNEIPMELHIQPLDSSGHFSWAILYGHDREAGLRPYELHVVNADRGLYAIDEKNSIRMEAYLLGGKFFQWFEVEDNLLFTTTELLGEEMVWEIVFGTTRPVSITGGQETEGEKIVAPVKTFPIDGLQRARLKRIQKK